MNNIPTTSPEREKYFNDLVENIDNTKILSSKKISMYGREIETIYVYCYCSEDIVSRYGETCPICLDPEGRKYNWWCSKCKWGACPCRGCGNWTPIFTICGECEQCDLDKACQK